MSTSIDPTAAAIDGVRHVAEELAAGVSLQRLREVARDSSRDPGLPVWLQRTLQDLALVVTRQADELVRLRQQINQDRGGDQ